MGSQHRQTGLQSLAGSEELSAGTQSPVRSRAVASATQELHVKLYLTFIHLNLNNYSGLVATALDSES